MKQTPQAPPSPSPPSPPPPADPEDAIDPRLAKWFRRIMIAGSLLLGLVLVEVTLHALADKGVIGAHVLPHQHFQYETAVFARHVFPAKETTVTLVDGRTYPINAHGYRGAAFSDIPQRLRVVIYGGSQVFDTNVPGFDDWPARVGRNLKAMGLDVEVINAGIPGHASPDSVGRLLTEGQTWAPDIVVLDHAWNDMKYFGLGKPLLRALKPPGKTDLRNHYVNGLDRVLCRVSRLYNTVRYRAVSWWLDAGAEGAIEHASQPQTVVDPAGVRQFGLNLAAMIAITRSIGAQPVLIRQPRLAWPTDGAAEKKAVEAYLSYVRLTWAGVLSAYAALDAELARVAKLHHVPVIDAAAAVSPTLANFTDAVHVTRAGGDKLAAAVATALAPIVRQRMTQRAAQ